MRKSLNVTVADFYESAKDKCSLELVIGEPGLSHAIREPAINRPGLALAGFFDHFAFKRIQVLGMAETEYLAGLTSAQREDCLRRLFAAHIPCLIVCRNRRIPREIYPLARQFQVPVLRSSLVTGALINLATVIMENLSAPRLTAHGTMVDIKGIGVMIEGKPSIGKSEAALALVKNGHSLVADDMTILRRNDDRTIVGSSSTITRYHIEIRGLGIIHVPSLFGVGSVRDEKVLDLIVTLCKFEDLKDESDLAPKKRLVLGVPIPHIMIPVAPGRELANLIEVATLDEKLKRMGHDAAKELDDKLVAILTKGAARGE